MQRPEITYDRNLPWNWCGSARRAPWPPAAGWAAARETRPTAPPWRPCRLAFDCVAIDGTVVIGEGQMDEAPMLYIGEKVGSGGPAMDIAVDPLEGTTITAKGGPNAMATVALAEKGNFLHAPDVYMDKIAVGPRPAAGRGGPGRLGRREPAQPGRRQEDRYWRTRALHPGPRPPRRDDRQGPEAGARIMLIGDGDVSGVIMAAQAHSGVDIFIGSGGAPEGVLAAAALRCLEGQMQGRLLFEDDAQVERARTMGIADPKRKYGLAEMAKGDVMFAATGVTTGADAAGRAALRHGGRDPLPGHALQVRHRPLCGSPP